VLNIPEFVSQYSNNLVHIATNYYDPASPNYLGNELDSLKTRLQTAVAADAVTTGRYKGNFYSCTSNGMFGWTITDFNNSYGTGPYANQHVAKSIKQYIAAMYSQAGTQLSLSGYAKTYNTMYVRGDCNGWGGTAMTLVGDYHWRATGLVFSGGSHDFKFADSTTDWDEDWGDDNNDGTAIYDSSSNIYVPSDGTYTIDFHTDTLAYTISP